MIGWFEQVKRGEDHYQYGKHHPTYYNITGQRFGKLVVVKQDAGKGVECRCDCGRTHQEAYTVSLRAGRRTSCGICTNRANPNFSREEDALIRKYAGIKSTEEIAELVTGLGLRIATIPTIKNRAKRLKISLRRIGERYPHAKGSDEDVELCRALYDAGMYPKEIAEKMEMSPSHVGAIVYYRSRTQNAPKNKAECSEAIA